MVNPVNVGNPNLDVFFNFLITCINVSWTYVTDHKNYFIGLIASAFLTYGAAFFFGVSAFHVDDDMNLLKSCKINLSKMRSITERDSYPKIAGFAGIVTAVHFFILVVFKPYITNKILNCYNAFTKETKCKINYFLGFLVAVSIAVIYRLLSLKAVTPFMILSFFFMGSVSCVYYYFMLPDYHQICFAMTSVFADFCVCLALSPVKGVDLWSITSLVNILLGHGSFLVLHFVRAQVEYHIQHRPNPPANRNQNNPAQNNPPLQDPQNGGGAPANQVPVIENNQNPNPPPPAVVNDENDGPQV